MKKINAAHGTERGYRQHLKDRESACAPCRRAANEANRLRKLEEPVELTGGRWVRRGLTSVWEKDKPLTGGWAKCGTDGGYYRHRRADQNEPCRPCRDAHAAAERDRADRLREETAA